MKKFLKIKIFLLLTLATIFICQSQNLAIESCGEGLQVRQIPNSNQELKLYFSRYQENDTLFAVIFPPANCPRCESLINPVLRSLKNIRPNIQSLLISVYPDSAIASKYLSKYGFLSDSYLYDESASYNKFLSFDAGYLHIPYLLKIKPSTGELIIGVRLEDGDNEFLNDFCMVTTPVEQKEYELSKKHNGYFKSPVNKLIPKTYYELNIPDSTYISEIIYQPEFYEDKLFFNDKLSESIKYFRISKKHDSCLDFQKDIRTNEIQNKMFIEVSDSVFSALQLDKDVRFIPLSPKMFDNNTLAISYSLPKLSYTSKNSIVYMNQASVLIVNLETGNSNLIPLLKNDEDFFYPHFNLFKYGNDFAIGCERLTWPMEFEKEEYSDNPILNPFSEKFYSYSQPIAAIFDYKSGILKKRISELPFLSRKTLTGYYFVSPVIDSWGNDIVISDGFSGQISLLKKNNTYDTHRYDLFNISTNILPEPDPSNFYSYDCVSPYINFFNRNVVDIKISQDYIYLLIRYGNHGKEDAVNDDYSVIKFDRNCNCSEEKTFDKSKYSSYNYFGLRRNKDGSIEPYKISKNQQKWIVTTYNF